MSNAKPTQITALELRYVIRQTYPVLHQDECASFRGLEDMPFHQKTNAFSPLCFQWFQTIRRYLQFDSAENVIIFNCESRSVNWPDCQGHANQNNNNEKFMKNPFLAFVLSLVVPGAGIAYLGQWFVGLVNLLVVIALWFSLTLSFGDVVERYVYSHYVIFAFFSAWVAMNLSVLKKMKDSIAVKQVESAAVSSTASVEVSSEPFIGQIQMFAFGFAPVNWAPCDGQVLQIKEHMALFSLLGNKYGGDGLSTFALPNLTAFEQNAGIKHFIAINGVFPTRN